MKYGLLTLDHIDDQSEAEEGAEHHVELFESLEDAAIALQSAKQAFNLVAALWRPAGPWPSFEQGTAFGRIVGFAAREQ